MAETVDVVIVGGGIAGASVAYHLATLGVRRVLVLESTAVAAGASGRASGLLTFLAGCHPVQAALLKYSFDFYHAWTDLVGGAPALMEVGALLLLPEAQRGAAARETALMQAAGHDARLIGRAEVQDLVPDWDLTGIDLAAYSPGSGVIDPPMATTALMNRARALGVRVYTGTPATGFLLEGGRVRGVQTARGAIQAGATVSAAGVWSAALVRLAGMAIEVAPAHHPVTHLSLPEGYAGRMPCCSDLPHNIYFRPEPGGLAAAGAMRAEPEFPIAPDALIEGFDAGAPSWLGPWAQARLARRIPALSAATVAGGHAGIYAVSPDGFPILGAVPGVEGLYCLSDGAGNGMTSGPGLGRALAEILVDGHAGIDTAIYAPDRFAAGRPNRPAYHHLGAELAAALF